MTPLLMTGKRLIRPRFSVRADPVIRATRSAKNLRERREHSPDSFFAKPLSEERC
jgi:hypothetical protein